MPEANIPITEMNAQNKAYLEIIEDTGMTLDVEVFLGDYATRHSKKAMHHEIALLLRKAFRNGSVTPERRIAELELMIEDLKKELESLLNKLK